MTGDGDLGKDRDGSAIEDYWLTICWKRLGLTVMREGVKVQEKSRLRGKKHVAEKELQGPK